MGRGKRTRSTMASASKAKAKREAVVAAAGPEQKDLAPLEALPVELFHEILHLLPAEDLLAIKFVSTSCYMMTKHANGAEVVNIKAKLELEQKETPQYQGRWYISARARHSVMVAQLERATRGKGRFTLLTCCHCGSRKPRGEAGFLDKHFKKDVRSRVCFACRKKMYYGLDEPIVIDGVPKMWCRLCEKLKDRMEAASKPLVDRLRRTISRRWLYSASYTVNKAHLEAYRKVLYYPNKGMHVCKSCYVEVNGRVGPDDIARPVRECRWA